MIISMLGAFLVSTGIVLILMPYYINFLKKISFNQAVSEYSLEEYQQKAKTPTMGGVLFVIVPVVVTFLFMPSAIFDLDVAIILLAFVGYGAIGFIDDYIIVIKQDNQGLLARHKFLLQVILAVIFFIVYQSHTSLDIMIPIIHTVVPLGGLYGVLIFFMFVGGSNAVNLTDGMDGLAAGCSVIAFIPFLIFALQTRNIGIVVFVASLLGALVGYLRYNMHPARIFMGDTGSLALGGALAAVAMVLKQEVALLFIGGVFVWETLCVIIQIGSVKLRGKRVFRYTPIHYSFVLQGMKEVKVVRSFWILSLICATLGFIIAVI
ncbi:phospho-N-acetylmuramoyl-pentapeptide-transferase [Anaerorhabdus furcosa]|uniref:Phospho-N-acetylmuramoyl-pentapeptide-transferase n=1 Tax=Anaerorhabdus furcosa TaxID=118967 RepID=A0A1T4NZU4_9FIRM|nr:phospho-N-acetylmuramoyl-pentapeptide-transferase [Anaerorhabdus furcosa]SJZ84794.1 Phospho-N-acetylmuramoyl-pentapeptide-transferase [Anaerorhabdus furcosa]